MHNSQPVQVMNYALCVFKRMRYFRPSRLCFFKFANVGRCRFSILSGTMGKYCHYEK